MAEFVPENELERLFLAGFGDPAARPAYYRAFLEGSVIFMDANPTGPLPATGDTELRIRLIQIEGVTHLPVFTSMSRVEAFGHREGRCLEIRTRALLDAVPGTPVIVNLGSKHSMGFSTVEVAALLNGTLFQSNDPDPRRMAVAGIEIAPLADPPFKLMLRLMQLFKTREAVRSAWIASMRNAAQNEQHHPLVAIETGSGWDALVREVMEILGTHGRPGEIVDVIRLDDGAFSGRVRREGKAFFQR